MGAYLYSSKVAWILALGSVPFNITNAAGQEGVPWLPLTLVARSLLSPADDVSASALASQEGPLLAQEKKSDVATAASKPQAAENAKFMFQYDDVGMLEDEEQLALSVATSAEGKEVTGDVSSPSPRAEIVTSEILLNREEPEFDPFFGGVVQLLGARPDQPYLPLEAIRPPTATQIVNEQLVRLGPTDKTVTKLDNPSQVAAGEVLHFRTQLAGQAGGRAVLLADGRAMSLQTIEWGDDLVKLQLPLLKLQQPCLARVFVARVDGVVVDYSEFMLVPRRE